eukprot:CCRYP_005115-RA/>CCRYP_005115-RA protein AED:0.46 eAED:0.46 QI:0/0/0/1/0/0/2/0/94
MQQQGTHKGTPGSQPSVMATTNVNKYFPQSEETQQGHMKNQRQGFRSTKQRVQPNVLPPTLPQQNDIYIKTYDSSNTLYTDQTGKFPHVSSRGF